MTPAIDSIARPQAPLLRLFALCALTFACVSGHTQVVMDTQTEAVAPVQTQTQTQTSTQTQLAQAATQAQPSGQSQTATAVPQLRSRVTDQTGTLTATARDALEQRLATFEKSKGTQIAVLLVNTTQPDSIEQYATRVFDQWKLGRKGTNDGVLMIVAKQDRTVRIEVGYGLEGAIPDAKASRIINEQITPRFKQGDFAGGLDAGVAAIEQLAQGEDLPPPAADSSMGAGAPAGALGWIIFVVVVIVAGGIMPNVGGAAVLGGIALNFLVGGIVMTVAGAVAAAILSAIFGLLGLRKGFGGRGGPGGGGWGGGFGGGGFGGGGGSSGGSSSGGGFSGGGGSSGGGGASGRW